MVLQMNGWLGCIGIVAVIEPLINIQILQVNYFFWHSICYSVNWTCCSYRAFDEHILFKFCKLSTFFLAFYLLIYWFLQMNGLVAAIEPLMSMKELKWHGIR